MSVFERVKELAKSKGLSISELERKLELSPNVLYKLKTQKPSIERIEAIANYFDVSVDYILGRTDKKNYWELTDKDEQTIQKQLEQIIQNMNEMEALSFSKDSEPMDEETKRLLIISIENSLRMGKELSKKKYTPKKYRDR